MLSRLIEEASQRKSYKERQSNWNSNLRIRRKLPKSLAPIMTASWDGAENLGWLLLKGNE